MKTMKVTTTDKIRWPARNSVSRGIRCAYSTPRNPSLSNILQVNNCSNQIVIFHLIKNRFNIELFLLLFLVPTVKRVPSPMVKYLKHIN